MRDRRLSATRACVGRFLTCLFVVAIPLARAAWGAPWTIADTVFKHVADDTALPGGASPLELAEDADGFLWEGSDGGLARFDGFHFRVYKADPAAPGSLPDGTIRSLHTDPRGRLWIGTNAGGLARYDGLRDRFVTYPAGPAGLSGVNVGALADNGGSGLWVGTNGGLDRLDMDTGRIRHLRHRKGNPGSLPDNVVRALLRDRSGALWVGTRHGLARLARGSIRFAPVRLPAIHPGGVDISALLEDRAGRMWIGTRGSGAFVVEAGATTGRLITESAPASGALPTESVTALAEIGPGEIWLGTVEDGIVAVDVRSRRTHRIRHDPTLPSSPSDDSVHALYRDRAGLIWVGTDRSLSYFDPRQTAVSTIFGPSSRGDGLTGSNVRAVLAARDGRVWLALAKNGIDIVDPARGRVAGLRPGVGHPETELPDGQTYGLTQTPAGAVYIATDGGLYRAAADGGKLARVAVRGRDPAAAVWAVFYGGGGLWLGAEDGLWKIDPLPAGARPLGGLPDALRLTDKRVTVFEPGPKGTLWIGTENGLNLYDPARRSVERFLPGRGPGALSAGLISCFFTDAKGRLWVGTQGGGLEVVEPRDSSGHVQFHHIGVGQGLPNDNVDKLLADRVGNVWASTDDGLAIINEATFAVRSLGSAQGVAIAGYWLNSGAATSSGDLLFGGLGGLTEVRPALASARTYRPRVVFTDVRVGGKSVPAARFNGNAKNEILTIAPGNTTLAADFAALDYAAPDETRFAYRLEGFEHDWTYADATRRMARYTNLPPGHYTLWVRGTMRDGTPLEPDLTLRVDVLAPWNQSDWFQGLELLAVLAAVALLVKVRTRYLRRNQQELARLVHERTAQLQQTNAELAASSAALEERQRQLEQLAYLDALTGLPNRRMFGESFHNLVELMGRHAGRSFALLLIDLDRFKEINDQLGHDAGDTLLAVTAARLRACVRQSDIVARFGGDEFAILLVEPEDSAGIEATCRRIVESFGEPILYKDQPMTTTPSIGVAVYPADGSTQDVLYRSADLALYSAKRTGRNTWRWYLATMGS